jgi:hypothetical protein
MENDLNIVSNGRNLNISANERRPQYFGEWKTTSIFWQMEDHLNKLKNGRQPQSFVKLKIISILKKGRRPIYFGK